MLMLLLIPYRRFKAILGGEIDVDDFELGESKSIPKTVVLANRNYMNLLELPVLFYFVCVLLYVTAAATSISLALSWSYVGLRIGHSVVHVSYNNVAHRFYLFAASNVLLLALLCMLSVSVIRMTTTIV